MKFRRLLAKSTQNESCPAPEETLAGHTAQVMEAASVLHETLAEELEKFLGAGFLADEYRTALLAAAWLHDIGKANSHFQEMIRRPAFRQGVRHETLGLVVLAEHLREPLQPLWNRYPLWLKPAVFFAVTGHHLKFPDDPDGKQRPKTDVVFLGGHSDLQDFWELGVQHLGVSPWKGGKNVIFSLRPFGSSSIPEKLQRLHRVLDEDFTPEQKLFIAALKSTLMAADLAGSALPPRGLTIDKWLRQRLETVLQKNQLENVIRQKVGQHQLRPFQSALARSKAHTVLVEAGCGSGKTVGAYLWCAKKADGKRLFFCYPTTGTAAEGFSGYLQDPDFEAILVNSRAALDYRLLENMPNESPSQKELHGFKLEALETWPVPAVVCTAHTVLGLLQNVHRSLYAWPSLIRSVFVFDEIHAYSPKLFGHLLRFLSTFRSHPALLMTATLPPERKRALEQICRVRGDLEILEGPKEREGAERYTLHQASEEEAWDEVTRVLAEEGKILWVSNTVDRAIERTRKAQDLGLPVEPYHSRYRYRDRVIRHRRVVDGFSPGRPPLLAMTTQVAEMSLDLSAHLLVTEDAPIPALIQRLGRLNRYEDSPEETRKALFIRPDSALPYIAKKEDEAAFWEMIDRWFGRIADGLPRSQRELGRAFIELAEETAAEFEEDLFCDWLDDPWSSLKNRHTLMEASPTVELVREEDLGNGTLQENAIPMPFPKDKSWHGWPQKGRYLIAPEGTIEYDSFWGGRYAREKSLYRII